MINLDRAIFHYDLMKKIYNQLLLSTDKRRKAALYGVEIAFRSTESLFKTRDGEYIANMTEEYQNISESVLNKCLHSRWGVKYYGLSACFDFTFFSIWLRYIFLGIKRKFVSKI
jgi:hypothetical protein